MSGAGPSGPGAFDAVAGWWGLGALSSHIINPPPSHIARLALLRPAPPNIFKRAQAPITQHTASKAPYGDSAVGARHSLHSLALRTASNCARPSCQADMWLTSPCGGRAAESAAWPAALRC